MPTKSTYAGGTFCHGSGVKIGAFIIGTETELALKSSCSYPERALGKVLHLNTLRATNAGHLYKVVVRKPITLLTF
jgi:hypothetical protein